MAIPSAQRMRAMRQRRRQAAYRGMVEQYPDPRWQPFLSAWAARGLRLPPTPAQAAMLGPVIKDIRPAQEIGWFAETAIEIGLASGRTEALMAWTNPPFGERYGGLKHWLVLADIADPASRGRRGEHLPAVERFAVRGRLSPELMHRLVTVAQHRAVSGCIKQALSAPRSGALSHS